MKNLKTAALFLLALVLSANAQAGDNKSEAKTKSETATKAASGTVLYWFTLSGSTLSFDAANTKADEIERSGCGETVTTECERAYTQDQLNNPSNPSQGVQPAKVNSYTDLIYIQE